MPHRLPEPPTFKSEDLLSDPPLDLHQGDVDEILLV